MSRTIYDELDLDVGSVVNTDSQATTEDFFPGLVVPTEATTIVDPEVESRTVRVNASHLSKLLSQHQEFIRVEKEWAEWARAESKRKRVERALKRLS